VDEHTRKCLDGPVGRSVDANKLVEHLDKVAAVRGWPRYLRCENGPELISNALADWAKDRTEKEKTTITFIEAGAPGRTRGSSRSTAACAMSASRSTTSPPCSKHA
jgi:putative transposase